MQTWEGRAAGVTAPEDAALRLALLLNGAHGNDTERARILLEAYLANDDNRHQGLRAFARYQLDLIEAEADETLALLRFAGRARELTVAEQQALIRRWEQRLAQDDATGQAALHLAALLGNPGRNSYGELSRARRLLQSYLANPAGKPPALLAFARYQLGVLDEGELWLRAVEREHRTRVELEHKLEALKAIERRMTDKEGSDKVPLR